MKTIIEENRINNIKLGKRIDETETKERLMDLKLQMVMDNQKQILHGYYELESQFKNVKRENKSLREEFQNMKRSSYK